MAGSPYPPNRMLLQWRAAAGQLPACIRNIPSTSLVGKAVKHLTGVEHHLAFDAATPAGRLLKPLRKGTGHKDGSAILAGASGLNQEDNILTTLERGLDLVERGVV